MFGGVQTKDVLSLTRSRIDGSHVLAALHLPNCRYHSVLFHRVIRNIFSRRLRCRIVGSGFSSSIELGCALSFSDIFRVTLLSKLL